MYHIGKKRLLLIINHYSEASEQHLFHVINLVKVIAEKGVEISLIIERCEGEKPYIHDNVYVYALKNKRGILRAIELVSLVNRIMKNGYKKAYVRITIPTAIIVSILGRINKCETYYWNSGGLNERPSDPHTSKESIRTIKRIKSVGKVVNHFVTGPENMLEFYPKYCGVPIKKMVLLYNDVDLKRFHPVSDEVKEKYRIELGLSQKKVYVLFVHRFSPIRRSEYYIPYCMQNIKNDNVEFLLIGDGPGKADVAKAVDESGIKNIRFLGSLPNSTIQKYYQSCDLFFNPSYCEGFPRVIIEAMACGMPIITTDAGGTADLFDEYQQQFVIDVDDRDLIESKLEEMILNKDVRKNCIAENLIRVKKYSTDDVSDMYIKAFWND